MMEDKIKRGNVFIADLSPTIGSEQFGKRPVVILSNNLSNKYSPTILIAPLTKVIKKEILPTHIFIEKNEFLKYDSLILLEQLRTIDKSRLTYYKGILSRTIMNRINIGLIDIEQIDIISYLKSLGVGDDYEKKNKLYCDYYSR